MNGEKKMEIRSGKKIGKKMHGRFETEKKNEQEKKEEDEDE